MNWFNCFYYVIITITCVVNIGNGIIVWVSIYEGHKLMVTKWEPRDNLHKLENRDDSFLYNFDILIYLTYFMIYISV